MLGFVIQRLLQAFIVMMVISFLVFLGVYAIGSRVFRPSPLSGPSTTTVALSRAAPAGRTAAGTGPGSP